MTNILISTLSNIHHFTLHMQRFQSGWSTTAEVYQAALDDIISDRAKQYNNELLRALVNNLHIPHGASTDTSMFTNTNTTGIGIGIGGGGGVSVSISAPSQRKAKSSPSADEGDRVVGSGVGNGFGFGFGSHGNNGNGLGANAPAPAAGGFGGAPTTTTDSDPFLAARGLGAANSSGGFGGTVAAHSSSVQYQPVLIGKSIEQPERLMSITAMSGYNKKSQEEIRFEDYANPNVLVPSPTGFGIANGNGDGDGKGIIATPTYG